MKDRDADLESMFAAARDRPSVDAATLDGADRRVRRSIRARRVRRQRLLATVALATLCVGGGALAAAVVQKIREPSQEKKPVNFDDGELMLRTGAERAVIHTPDLILTIPPEAAVEITVHKKKTQRVTSRRGYVRLEQPDVAPLEIDPGAAWTPTGTVPAARPAEIKLDPPEPPPAPRNKYEYRPRAIREVDTE